MNAHAIFSGVERRVTAKDFRFGRISAGIRRRRTRFSATPTSTATPPSWKSTQSSAASNFACLKTGTSKPRTRLFLADIPTRRGMRIARMTPRLAGKQNFGHQRHSHVRWRRGQKLSPLMHPILTRGSYLGAYLAVWLPLACLLIFLVRVSGGMGTFESALLFGPMAIVFALASLSAWYSCRATPLRQRRYHAAIRHASRRAR